MNAKEASQLTNQYVDPKLDQLLKAIEAEATIGGDCIFEYNSLSDKTKSALEFMGYTVKFIESFRDASWKISW